MAISIVDKTINPVLVTDGQTVDPFSQVTVADTAALDATETVSIKLFQDVTTNGNPGSNWSFYPTETNLGTLSDPTGGGSFNAATNTFSEQGVIGGDPTFATNLLKRLVYTAPGLSNGQGFAVQAAVTVDDGSSLTTDPQADFIAVVAPPAITGTVANQPVASGGSIPPFATANIGALSFGYNHYDITAGSPYNNYNYDGPSYSYNSHDSATIVITDGGAPTDADGLLTGPGLSKTGVGTYTLAAIYELRQLSFQTVAVPAGQTKTVAFELDATDPTSGLTTKDTNTSLSVIGPFAGPPRIAGLQSSQTVAPGNVIDPFNSVTVSDTEQNASDSAVITVTNASGQATDANGTLTGIGLTETAAGTYTLAGTDTKTLTTELDALTFHPTGLPGGTNSETTNFSLTVTDNTDSQTALGTTSVIEQTPPPTGDTFLVFDTSRGNVETNMYGQAYTGPYQGGLHDEFDLSGNPDAIAIRTTGPNEFISAGAGSADCAIDVSAGGGNNVLLGNAISNFLIGGSGSDIFFLNDANPPSPSWSTLVDFHTGDQSTIWGVSAADFANVNWLGDTQGAPGFTGLTGEFQRAGLPPVLITLAGYSMADLSDGKLAFSNGADPRTGVSYLMISPH